MPVPRIVTRLAWLVALAAVAACSSSPSVGPSTIPGSAGATSTAALASPSAAVPAASPVASLDRVAGWQADIAAIVPGLERIHPNPFHGTSKGDLEAAAAALSATAPTLGDDQLMAGVARIAALVSARGCDGHTGLYVWGTGTYPVDSLPLRLWLFGDDVVIVDALAPHQDLVGAKIEAIEGQPIEEVRAALDPLIPRDNDQTVRLLTPRYLLIPQVLRGIGLANDSSVRLRYSAGGQSREVDLASIPMADYNAWAGPYGLHLPVPPGRTDVRSLSRVGEDLWWELLPDGATLYVQDNRLEPVDSSVEELRAALRAPELTRVVLDIRNNFGGEVRPIDTLVGLFDDPAVDQPGKLFVITGRNTFSAASMLAARLEAKTGAIFVGEPMSGCPTTYGDNVELPLPNSGLTLLVSSLLEPGVDPGDTRTTIPLDATAELTQEEWAAGDDPAMDLITVAAP
jgi:hypothetical protein